MGDNQIWRSKKCVGVDLLGVICRASMKELQMVVANYSGADEPNFSCILDAARVVGMFIIFIIHYKIFF